MTRTAWVFLLCVFIARVRLPVQGSEGGASDDPFTESRKVLTTSGKECKFPFREGGRIHHQCISLSSSRPWCSLTPNFDRDRRWGFCVPEIRKPDVFVNMSRRTANPCQQNPCRNGGSCTSSPSSFWFQCSCPESFTGRLCEQKKCYETVHLRFYDIGESWGRVHLRNVEQCTCIAGEIKCERVSYTVCRVNACQNEGTCRMITATGKEVCYCRRGFSGADCSLEPETKCYRGKGAAYRGVVGTTVSGARCLPWNSELMFDEFHVGTVDASPLKGLGEHAYCRNPDGDKMPWCYILNHSAISWEYCDIPSCVLSLISSKRTDLVQAHPRMIKPLWTKPTKKPVCGKKHKKRFSIPRGRIMGGSSALPGAHPWMAAIYIGQSDFCAGTLISSCWIVSAAHCFLRNPLESQVRVVFGQQFFNYSGPYSKTFGVEKYIFPKQFSVYNPTLHDIVLVKLKKQDGRCVRRSPFIRPICLPDKKMVFPDYYCCAISGWGYTYEKENRYSHLREAGVRLVPQDVCNKPEVFGNHVTSDMICAGLNGCTDACQGDSGGPLACAKGDVSFLYGIISWGEGCGRTGKPGVYTNVVKYLDWIHSVIKRKPKNS